MKEISELLKCPDCGGCIDTVLACKSCKRKYDYEDDICDMMPSKEIVPELNIYKEPNYKKFYALQGETEGYLYRNKNPLINWVQSSGYRAIKRLFREHKGMALECGCGTGIFQEIHGGIVPKKYVMLDADRCSLTKIHMRQNLAAVIRGTNYRLPFVDRSFDVVISHAQLEHLAFLDLALEEIKRVLKPSGIFFASMPNEGGLLWTKGREMTSARHFGELLKIDYIKSNRIDHINTIHQIDRALRRHFVIKERIFFPFFLSSFNFNFTTTYSLFPAT
jgi:SAM-dependent methyltransferase